MGSAVCIRGDHIDWSIGLTTMHRVLSRLGRITHAMTRLARNDTTTAIPSRDDRDEVGAMARAVEVFKNNAIQLIAERSSSSSSIAGSTSP